MQVFSASIGSFARGRIAESGRPPRRFALRSGLLCAGQWMANIGKMSRMRTVSFGMAYLWYYSVEYTNEDG